MTIIRCTECKGNKQIMTLGCIQKKCPKCLGIGYESTTTPEEVDEFLEKKVDENEVEKVKSNGKKVLVVVKKKMGRAVKNKVA